MLRIHVIALFSYRLFIASNVYCPCPPRGLFFDSCNRESGNGKGNPPSPSHPPPPRPATHIPCFCIKVARGLICRMIKITGGLRPSDTVIFSHTGEKQSTKKNWSIQNEYVDDFRGKDTMFRSSQLLFIFPRRAAVGSF